MAQTTLTDILDALKMLAPDELRQVQHAVAQQLAPQPLALEEERFLHALLAQGVIQTIKRPPRYRQGERPLVPIQGPPLSATIVAERR
jgi:hypothetical protein